MPIFGRVSRRGSWNRLAALTPRALIAHGYVLFWTVLPLVRVSSHSGSLQVVKTLLTPWNECRLGPAPHEPPCADSTGTLEAESGIMGYSQA